MLDEMQSLTKNVDHIKTIVAMQQSYAGVAGVVETVIAGGAGRRRAAMNASSLDKYRIEVVREYADLPDVSSREAEAAADPGQPGDQREGRAGRRRSRAASG